MTDQNQMIINMLKNGTKKNPSISDPSAIPEGVINPLTIMPNNPFVSRPTPGPKVPTDESVDPRFYSPSKPLDTLWK